MEIGNVNFYELAVQLSPRGLPQGRLPYVGKKSSRHLVKHPRADSDVTQQRAVGSTLQK